jgi:hypothetical protein
MSDLIKMGFNFAANALDRPRSRSLIFTRHSASRRGGLR